MFHHLLPPACIQLCLLLLQGLLLAVAEAFWWCSWVWLQRRRTAQQTESCCSAAAAVSATVDLSAFSVVETFHPYVLVLHHHAGQHQHVTIAAVTALAPVGQA
jgi:hypothetical protein